MTGKEIMKGSRYRCNFYRISSLVVMLFVVFFLYWSMFSTSSVNGEERSQKLLAGTRNLKGGNIDRNEFAQSKEDFQQSPHIHPPSDDDTKTQFTQDKLYKDDETERHFPEAPVSSEKEKDLPVESTSQERSQNLPAKNTASQDLPKILEGTQEQNLQNDPTHIVNQPQDNSLNQWNPPKVNGDTPALQSKTDKWIVLTSIQSPTEDVKFLAELDGWNIVVAGDTKTPDDWSYKNIHFLSIEKQNQLDLDTVRLLKEKSYSRKNAGYLYALKNGARIIYETDDDNRPLDLLKNFVYDKYTSGLKFVGQNYFNPYRHFGQPTLWPRGYPLGYIGGNYTDRYLLGTFKTPSVQQGVVNGDPDMGAMFRLTRKTTTEMLNVSFDSEAPPAFVPPGVLVPYNSQNTFFLYDALWSLIIPQTVTFRTCDIWRGYWAQRLLWEIDATLGFFGPNAFQKRNSHSYVADAIDEEYLYFKTHDLFDFLLEWRCDKSKTFFQCGNLLTEEMRDKGFWKDGDVQLISAWFMDLKKIGYQEPKRVDFTLTKSGSYLKTGDESKASFTAREMHPPMYYNSKYIVSSYWSRVDKVLRMCNPLPVQITQSSTKQPEHSDIVLIVVFQTSNYEIIPRINTLYGSKFPHIAYCGSDFSRFEDRSKSFSEPVTFVEANIESGYFSYRCISKVMKMKYRVKGYMMIGSETLINPWVFDTMNQRDLIWFDHSKLLRGISRQAVEMKSWNGWQSEFGKTALNKAWASLVEKNKEVGRSMLDFERNLNQNSKLQDGVFVGPSDVVYIPTKFSEMFVMYADIFSGYNVLHEIVVPTIISGLDVAGNMIPLNGKYLWTEEDKTNFANKFDSNLAFLHPVNIARSMGTEQGMNFFCTRFLPMVIGGNKSQSTQKQFTQRR